MAEHKPLRVMTKGGRSYVELPYESGSVSHLINGKEPVVAPGHKGWRITEGDLVSIVRITQQSAKLVAWTLRDDCKGADKAESLAPDAFSRWDEYEAGHDRHFYEEKLEAQEPLREELPFESIERGGEPVALPRYVEVDFPKNLDNIPELQHLYPCRIRYKNVFPLLYAKLAEWVASHDDYTRDSFENIQTLTIKRRVWIPSDAQCVETESYYPTLRARKPRTRKVTRRERWVKALEVVGTYEARGRDVIQVEDVQGATYKDLVANLAAYIQRFLDVLAPDRLEVCGHCKGAGVRTVPEPPRA